VTSTVLTLVVIPSLYFLWRRRGLEGSEEAPLWATERFIVKET
jgi:hypothetical protein